MRVLIAFDKFKDSLSAAQACDVAARSLRGRHRDWTLDLCPLADGGEGFAEILTTATGGTLHRLPVQGPRGGLVTAQLGLVPRATIPAAAQALLGFDAASASGTIAVIEMAQASGLALLPPGLRDPWETTSLGTGQLIRAAAELGATGVVLGVGGSATNDLGLGALAALGFEFRDDTGNKLRPPLPAQWPRLTRIDGEAFTALPPLRIACDVANPLLGPQGCAAIYGPQKGLRAEDRPRLEAESARLADLLCAHCGQPPALRDIPGAGAAGGIAFGLMVAARARLCPGADLVAAWLDLGRRLDAADLVLTGEGRFDASSLTGKGPGSLATRALGLGKTVHVFAGAVALDTLPAGLHTHAITPADTPLAQALRDAPALLAGAVQRAFD
ncbi:MAG TPA: glycerate kinase [Opitutaceae bacterium]